MRKSLAEQLKGFKVDRQMESFTQCKCGRIFDVNGVCRVCNKEIIQPTSRNYVIRKGGDK